MNSSELIMEGAELMLLGMGSVFVFLILLVVVTTVMSRVLTRFFPEAIPVPRAPAKRPKASSAGIDPELIAVIGAAIKQHRSRS
ncbi:OadG family protein [Halopseudomonas pelagia]|uniref:OadG family protein n=1 Tax=Halopseudomonas pelagia TaxID=553151 RepID=UPI0003A7C975|nr:OadG family protein [Halopseudomonas pelagia]|tara:strand:- start:121755 stop:122006 length:252 start_codon:yes stop_codon:yes gene_type:complete